MAEMNKRERVEAALAGERVDRPPVAAWQHFIPAERTVSALSNASLHSFHQFDWDWLKVNPRATYYAEAWGNRYDFDRYDGVLPRLISGPITRPADFDKIASVSSTEGVFAEQLELVKRIKSGINGAHFVQTVFSPLSVLAFLTTRPGDQNVDLGLDSSFERLRSFLQENPAGAHAALDAISSTLADYAAATLSAGASGLFFAIVRLAREGVFTPQEYSVWGRPYDLRVLAAVEEASFNLLHICGPKAYVDQVVDYPVHALNWAAVGQGNPNIAEARSFTKLALIGGVDEHGALSHGDEAAVLAEAQIALDAGGERRFLLAPGCGIDMHTSPANLHALRRAVDR